MQNCGDNLSVFDNSKVFQLEERCQVLWTFSNAFLQLVELPLRNFILSELLIFDLVVLSSCFSWNFNNFIQFFNNCLLFFIQVLLNAYLVFNIFVKQFLLFVLPAIAEVFHQLYQNLPLSWGYFFILAQSVRAYYKLSLLCGQFSVFLFELFTLLLFQSFLNLSKLSFDILDRCFIVLLCGFCQFLLQSLLFSLDLFDFFSFCFLPFLYLAQILDSGFKCNVQNVFCEVWIIDKWYCNICAKFRQSEIMHILIFHHIRNVDILVPYLHSSVLCGLWVVER